MAESRDVLDTVDTVDTVDTTDIPITLGDRMKQYEKAILPQKIPSYQSFIIRLDGCCFSKFTKPLKKPFDIMFTKAMCFTLQDLLKKFYANTGYNHSDEITLIFNKQESELSTHLYDGRTSKLLSVIAAYCSIRFNYHFHEIINDIQFDTFNLGSSDDNCKNDKSTDDERTFGFIDNMDKKCFEQIFDARIMILEPYEILNHQIWRSVIDCHRNAVSTYADSVYSHETLHKKTTAEKIEMLRSKNIIWESLPTFIKYGLYCKKILYETDVINPNGEKVSRSRYEFKNFKISFSEENINMLMSKYWDNEHDIYGESISIKSLKQKLILPQ